MTLDHLAFITCATMNSDSQAIIDPVTNGPNAYTKVATAPNIATNSIAIVTLSLI